MRIDRRTLVAATAAMLGASACRAGEPAHASGGPGKLALLGQQGHGKTTLAAAIARARPGGHELIDRPGAPAAVPAVIEGLWAADAAVLLVSAADGPMPQTREHILLARQMRVENLVVFLSKADLNDDAELLELIELETRDLLSAYQLAGDQVTVVTGSAKLALEGGTGETGQPSVQKLLAAIDALPASRRRQAKGAAPARRFSAETYILTPEEDGLRGPAPEAWPVELFFESGLSGPAVIRGEPGAGPIQPGENRAVVLELDAAAPVEQVTRFAIRGDGRTLGAGVVTGVT